MTHENTTVPEPAVIVEILNEPDVTVEIVIPELPRVFAAGYFRITTP
jgi:hypothetical protein